MLDKLKRIFKKGEVMTKVNCPWSNCKFNAFDNKTQLELICTNPEISLANCGVELKYINLDRTITSSNRDEFLSCISFEPKDAEETTN